MADEVEGVKVLAEFLDDGGEREALCGEFVEDCLLARGVLPAFEEVVEAGETLSERLLGVVAQGFGDEFAEFVEILDALGDDGGADAVDVDFLPPGAAGRDGDVGRAIDDGFIGAGRCGEGLGVVPGGRNVVGRGNGVALAGFVDLHGVTVEIRVGEVVGGAAEVDQGEVELAGVLVHAGAAAHDLLELGHRADFAVEHDEAAGLRIDAGGEQAGGGDEDGAF